MANGTTTGTAPSSTTRGPEYEKARQEYEAARQQTGVGTYRQEQATQAAMEGLATEEERKKARDALAALGAGIGDAAAAQQQRDLAAALTAQATGAAPGAGQLQLQRALEATQAATAAQIGSARGMNFAQAQRLALQQQAAQAQQAAGQSAIVGLEEQKLARQQLGELLGTLRTQGVAEQQLAANIQTALRTGDQNAVQAAIQAAQAEQQANLEGQARALGLLDAEGRLDIAATQLRVQAELARIEREFRAGQLDDAQAEAERTYWRDLLVNMQLGAQAAAGSAAMATSMGRAKGGRINGRGMVPGDHPANDVVPAMLSPGEIVLPRSIAQAEDAPEKAAAFVRALQEAETKPLSRRSAAKRIAELEAELAALRAMRADKEGGR